MSDNKELDNDKVRGALLTIAGFIDFPGQHNKCDKDDLIDVIEGFIEGLKDGVFDREEIERGE